MPLLANTLPGIALTLTILIPALVVKHSKQFSVLF